MGSLSRPKLSLWRKHSTASPQKPISSIVVAEWAKAALTPDIHGPHAAHTLHALANQQPSPRSRIRSRSQRFLAKSSAGGRRSCTAKAIVATRPLHLRTAVVSKGTRTTPHVAQRGGWRHP